MKVIDIIVIIVVVVVVLAIIFRYIYKRKKNLPVGECSGCSNTKNVKRMVKDIKKELDKELEKCPNCKKKSS